MSIRVYVVEDGDTIENVALRTTGDAANWRMLVAFNRLRAPYLSNDPRDWPGVVLASGTLPGPVLAGALSVPLFVDPADGPNPTLVDVGGTLLLSTIDRGGALVADALSCVGYNAAAAAVAVAVGVPRAYPAGAAWALSAFEQPLKVLRTGDGLLVPDGPDVAVLPAAVLTDFLGTDIALGDDGTIALALAQPAVGAATLTAAPPPAANLLIPAGLGLVARDGTRFATTEAAILPGGGGGATSVDVPIRSAASGAAASIDAHALVAIDPATTAPIVAATLTAVDNARPLAGLDGSGDLATARGLDNMRQAIVHRLATRLGELPYAPTYGNGAFDALGVPNRYVQQALIEAAVIEAAAGDDRVAAVQGGTLARGPDSLTLSVDVLLRGIDYRLTLREIEISLLNGQPVAGRPSP